jgi:diaminopimelate epimerase
VVRREDPAEGSVVWWIESGMGVPRVMRRAIEIDGVGGAIEGAMVNVGNPHFVIFTEREDFGWRGVGGEMSWQELGAKISVDPLFRFGTNVEFVRVLAQDEIAFRIFERGGDGAGRGGTGTDGGGGGWSAAGCVAGRCERDDADGTGGDHLHWRG